MSKPATSSPSILGEPLRSELKNLFREVLREQLGATGQNGQGGKQSVGRDNPYLSIKQAAELACLAPSTIRLLIRKRQLNALKIGRRVLIKRADLEEFLEANPIEALHD